MMIPREIYTLGAVQLNTQRLAELEGQILAKREAKRQAETEAIDKYLVDLAGKLTPTGVRAIDLPGFEDRRKKWVQFSVLNKEKIKKDPLTRMEADRLYNDALSWVQQSKVAEEEKKPAIDLIKNPNTRNQLNTERVITDIASHDLSLDDPNRRKIDYNSAWYKAPTFDFNKEFEASAKGQQKSFLRKIPGTLDRQLGTIQTEEGFLPESVKQIAKNFTRNVIEDPSKYDYYERKVDTMDARELVRLNQVLNRYFPDIKIAPNEPEALAMAEAIERAESIKDVVPKQDVSYASSLIASRKGGQGAGEGAFRDLYKEIDLATSSPQRLRGGKGAPVNILSGAAQSALIKLANNVTGTNDYDQTNIYVKKFSDGKNYIVDVATNEPLIPFTEEDINIGAQVDVGGKRGALTGKVPVPQSLKKQNLYSINGKNYTESQLLQMGYTKEQIAPYIKK